MSFLLTPTLVAASAATLFSPSFLLPANVVVALLAAIAWGAGDFSGGMGVKASTGTTAGAIRFLLLAHSISVSILLVILFARHAALPHGAPMYWGLAAGVAAGLSVTAFYMALARGAMGPSAALSGVIAAAIPALVSTWMEGAPHTSGLAGFAVAAAAIWFIASAPATSSSDLHSNDLASVSPAEKSSGSTTILAIIGGFGFGIYFTALRFANPLGVLEPIALARLASIATCTLMLLFLPKDKLPKAKSAAPKWVSPRLLLWAGGVVLLDTGGNLLFTWATRLGRLDVAAVLASLYPASTILLAAWQLHERPTVRQWLGMGLALAAVVLITL